MPRARGLGPQGKRAAQQAADIMSAQEDARRKVAAEGDPGSVDTDETSVTLTTAPVEDPSDIYTIPPSTDVNPTQSEQETLPDYFTEFESSRVVRAAYDPDSRRLYVRFVKPKADGGTPWTYNDVPPKIWRNFLRAKSAGKYVNRVLTPRGNYNRGSWDEGY